MSRFLLGDQLGGIRVLRYSPQNNSIEFKTVYHQEITPASSVERLAINSSTSNDQTTVRAKLHFFLEVEIDNQGKLAAAFSNGSLLLSALKEDDTFEVLAKWNEPRLSENKFIGLSLDERYCDLTNLTNFVHPFPLAAVPSSVALPMESCKKRHVTLEAIAVCNPLTIHLFPVDCVTGECPIIEKPSLMAATKWIFQFGAQNSHGSPN
jgi:hypothetical protein